MIAAGIYKGRVTDWAITQAQTGNKQLAFKFQITGKVDEAFPDGELIPCSPDERTIYRAITDKTFDWVIQDLEHLGYDKNGFVYIDRNHPEAHDFTGAEVTVRCKHDNYEGKTKEKWEFAWGGGGGGELKAIESGEIKKLDAMFGKKWARRGKPAVAASTPKSDPHSAPPVNDDDQIPF